MNTVIKDDESNLVQIASRGNYFNNFLTVDVTDDEINIRCHNEKGDKRIRYNLHYETSGKLVIDKSGNATEINGWGQMALIDRSAPMIHFNFDDKLPLNSRSILGLGLIPGVQVYKPFLDSVPVNGKECSEVLPNIGEFGSDYDAQTVGVNIVQGLGAGKAGQFGEGSRAGIWAMGPHFGGREISYSLWIKTTAKDMPILISYEGYWIKPQVMNLRLRNGRPELVVSATAKLKAKNANELRVNDGDWHHLVVSHDTDGGMLSEIKIYIDGKNVKTKTQGEDLIVDFPNGGVLSLGGFGHGRSSNLKNRESRTGFQNGDEYKGLMDEVKIFGKGLSSEEVASLYAEFSPPTISPVTYPSSDAGVSAQFKSSHANDAKGILER